MSSSQVSQKMKSMEHESDKMKIENIIFNYPNRPSKKSVIVGIPMFVYRIQTNSFRSGLNFFQKAVLKFKAKPGFPNDLIAQYLGVDVKLVEAIRSELVVEKMIGPDGLLTQKGKACKLCLDGLIVNDGTKQIGYLFRYLDEDKYYPYYVDGYRTPNVTSEPEPRINGVKGDDFLYKVLYAKEILGKRYNTLPPDESRIFSLINNFSSKMDVDDSERAEDRLKERELSIKFIPDAEPQLVWVCTYAYLREIGNESYASDWCILDPFSPDREDNVSLKLHIKYSAPELSAKIDEAFADVQTVERKVFMEAHFHMEKQIESAILKDFPLPDRVDDKLYGYLQTIVRTKMSMEYLGFRDEAVAREFSTALSGLFESLLKQHREKFPTQYGNMLAEFAEDVAKRKQVLRGIFNHLFNKVAPVELMSAAKARLHSPNGLRAHLVSTILTKMYTDQFYMLILKYHVDLNEICMIRNERGHGHTARERVDENLTQEQVEKYYSFLQSFIYEYTNL